VKKNPTNHSPRWMIRFRPARFSQAWFRQSRSSQAPGIPANPGCMGSSLAGSGWNRSRRRQLAALLVGRSWDGNGEPMQ
jgi:hypothetical protein